MASSLSFDKIGKKNNNNNLLADLSFGAEKGEVLFILGKNHSGKSTLFKILMGLIQKDKGKIFVNGMDYDLRKTEILPLIGYMPQEDSFDYDLNIFDNLSFYAQLNGLNKNNAKKNIFQWADKFDLRKYLKSNIKDISKGVLKKISFIRALIHNPDFLLLDNPTSEMDLYDRNNFFDIINQIKKDKTILIISNNFKEAELHSDRIIIIHNASVCLNGNMKNILKTMRTIYKYRISFKRLVPNDFLKKMKENKSIVKLISRERHIEFSVYEESVFLKIIKAAFEYDLVSIKTVSSRLNDIFLRVIEK
tara:strand:- start:220 stop:1137 length:918 start_codon:yes stop_codon:yes gene_type:complete